MDSQDRYAHRRVILDAWRKAKLGDPLSALDAQIIAIVRQHPEYHAFLDDPKGAVAQAATSGATNLFLHLSLHLAILEQLSIDQPPGIRSLYQRLLGRLGNPHQVEHRIMDCLAELIWQVQHQRAQFDHVIYLDCIRRLAE